jgi:hypothetical protein
VLLCAVDFVLLPFDVVRRRLLAVLVVAMSWLLYSRNVLAG